MGGLFSDQSRESLLGAGAGVRNWNLALTSFQCKRRGLFWSVVESCLFIVRAKPYRLVIRGGTSIAQSYSCISVTIFTIEKRDEQQLKELLERAIAEAAMRSALEAANGDEILAIKMLRFVEGERAGNDTNTKQWQPDEQQVQKLVEMGFAEAAVRSALEAVNGDEILAIKMLRFAEHARAGNYTNTKV
ncbi:hypothetical protein CMV_025073 [Castanea mollissima]|uniref:UBA domain-containing protein n=1 Tax=Castanea mollissima TaxID=60419 RepID=A0A8J4QF73_9ROSI|nr:hypothetical protein CMV_025073 [Castanea mollissima]